MNEKFLDSFAESIQQNSKSFVDAEKEKGSMYMVPKPPGPGEIMYCQICGKPMLPKDFSEDLERKKYEFKWQIHWDCKEREFEIAERGMVGFVRDRQESLKRIRENGRTIKNGNSDPRRN